MERKLVWDLPVRLFHWLLVLLFAAAWLTAELGLTDLHFYAGYGIATLLLFRLGAWGLQALAARAPRSRFPAVRLGLANLHRPGAPTGLMLVSLGLGLSTLAAVALIQGNIQRQVTETMPDAAPAFFFIDIQNDQLARFEGLLAERPGVGEVRHVPSLRARIVSVAGVPADQVQATSDTSWALRGDRGLTYAATPPEGTQLVEGAWWPADYRGPPLVSFDARLAEGWGVRIGDTIRVSLTPEPGGDRTLEVKVAQELLQTMGFRTFVPLVAACPGCGRTTSTVFQELARDIQTWISDSMPRWRETHPGVETLNVAVMGCIVNGPGESKHADIGISLPGTGEAPTAPVFIDGRKAATLRGPAIADEFKAMVGDYIERRFGAAAQAGEPEGDREGTNTSA